MFEQEYKDLQNGAEVSIQTNHSACSVFLDYLVIAPHILRLTQIACVSCDPKAKRLCNLGHGRNDNYGIEMGNVRPAEKRRISIAAICLLISVDICKEEGGYFPFFGELGHPDIVFKPVLVS